MEFFPPLFHYISNWLLLESLICKYSWIASGQVSTALHWAEYKGDVQKHWKTIKIFPEVSQSGARHYIARHTAKHAQFLFICLPQMPAVHPTLSTDLQVSSALSGGDGGPFKVTQTSISRFISTLSIHYADQHLLNWDPALLEWQRIMS